MTAAVQIQNDTMAKTLCIPCSKCRSMVDLPGKLMARTICIEPAKVDRGYVYLAKIVTEYWMKWAGSCRLCGSDLELIREGNREHAESITELNPPVVWADFAERYQT